MTGTLQGRAAIVTGASRGIGFAIASSLLEDGADVCITGRDEAKLRAAAARLEEADRGPGRVLAVAGDSGDPDHRAHAVATTQEAFGAIDMLVNNTGINPAFGPLMKTDLGRFEKTLAVNLVSSLGWVQQVYQRSMRGRGGTIVNVASAVALRPSRNLGAYAASKAGLLSLTQQLALELGPLVRVNAVAPAVVRTEFATPLFEGSENELASEYPMGRLGAAGDVAGAVSFLLSDAAAWITGEVLSVDGGLSLTGGVES